MLTLYLSFRSMGPSIFNVLSPGRCSFATAPSGSSNRALRPRRYVFAFDERRGRQIVGLREHDVVLHVDRPVALPQVAGMK